MRGYQDAGHTPSCPCHSASPVPQGNPSGGVTANDPWYSLGGDNNCLRHGWCKNGIGGVGSMLNWCLARGGSTGYQGGQPCGFYGGHSDTTVISPGDGHGCDGCCYVCFAPCQSQSMNHLCSVEPQQIGYRRKAFVSARGWFLGCTDAWCWDKNEWDMEKVMPTFYMDWLLILDFWLYYSEQNKTKHPKQSMLNSS